LLIIAEEVDGEALARWWSTPCAAFESGGCQGPRLRRSPKPSLEDIACLTGGKVIAEEVGMSLEK
jgi:chaperonin GroEL